MEVSWEQALREQSYYGNNVGGLNGIFDFFKSTPAPEEATPVPEEAPAPIEERIRSRSTIRRKATQPVVVGATSGAVAGATVGTMIVPGLGTVIGGLIGAGAGAAGGFFKGKKDAKKLKKERNIAIANQQTALAAQRAVELAERQEKEAKASDIRRKRLQIKNQVSILLDYMRRQDNPKVNPYFQQLVQETKEIYDTSLSEEDPENLVLLSNQLNEISADTQELVRNQMYLTLNGLSGLADMGSCCAPCGSGLPCNGLGRYGDVSAERFYFRQEKQTPFLGDVGRYGEVPQERFYFRQPKPSTFLGGLDEDMGLWLEETRNRNRAAMGLPPTASPSESVGMGNTGLAIGAALFGLFVVSKL